jgi:hypothetical protein
MVETKVTQKELAALAGRLDFVKGIIEIDRHIYGKESYDHISKTVENAIDECRDIAERLLMLGLEAK